MMVVRRCNRWLGCSGVAVVLRPRAGDGRPELRLRVEPERLTERLRMLGLQPDVLPRHPLQLLADQGRCDARAEVRRGCPHIDQVCIEKPLAKGRAIPTKLRGSAGGNVPEDGCTVKRALVLPLPVVEDRAGPAQENPLAGDAAGADLAAVEILNNVRSDERREHQDADR